MKTLLEPFQTKLINSSGFVTFTLKEFQFDKTQGYGVCCSAGGGGNFYKQCVF